MSRRLLLAALHFGLLRFPVSAVPGDRPDLRLKLPDMEVGVEITETVSPSLAQAYAIAQRQYPDAIIDRSQFPWGRHYSPQEIHDLLRRGHRLNGPGWVGDSVEKEWAEASNETVQAKTASLNKPGYGVADRYWLVAYSSMPGPALDIAAASKLLAPLGRTANPRDFQIAILLTDSSAVLLSIHGVDAVLENVPDPSNSLQTDREG